MPAKKGIEWNTLIRECLDSTTVAVLATSNGSDVWAVPVYFSYDDSFNIYFISSGDTRHMEDIMTHPEVSVAIVMPHRPGMHQVFVQVNGIATEVPEEDIEEVYAMRNRKLAYRGMHSGMEHEGHFVRQHGGIFMRISPRMMRYMNTEIFGSSPEIVPIADIAGKARESRMKE